MMSDEWDSNELGALLRSPEVHRDPKRYLKVVQNVIACMTLGIDVSNVFSEMIKAGATSDLVQKKLVYLYLSNYAQSNSELALLTVNTMQKDCQDRDPMVRGLALKSMCSLRLPNIVQYLCEPLQTGLKDGYGYVRRIAVMGVAKLYYVAPDIVTKLNFVDILYQMLRDRDPQVVSNCISALNELLASEGGMVVNSKITHYLLNRLRDFSEWSQCQILDLLHCYQPSSEDEVFDIMSILDDRLKHSSIGVAMGTIRLFIHLTQSMPDMQPQVYERIHTPLLTFLGSSFSELVYTCLQHIQLLLARQPNMWSKDYQNFFCRYKDPPYLKIKKLELLTEVCTIGNAQSIVDELGESATDVNVFVARRAVQAIGQVALLAETNGCVDKLLFLLKMNVSYITTETLLALTSILRKYENMVEVIIPQLPTSFDSITDPEGRSALIWILGEYGESLPNTPYVLEEVVRNISEESSSAVKLQLLSAVMKMFFKRPPECQEMLGRLLEYCIDYREGDMDVHCRAMLYYRLLQHNLKQAQRVVCGQVEKSVASRTRLPQKLSLFPEFNTLSVMYGKPSSDFITQECPYVLGDATPSSKPESISCFGDYDSSTVQKKSDFYSFQRVFQCDTDSKFPAILLNPKPVLTAGEFEKMWLSMKNVEELQVHLSHVPSVEELKKTLASRFIMTMATSPPDQPVVKMFFYAQHVSTFHFFLMEVTIAVANAMLSFVLKCENPKQAPSFLKHFFKTLGLSDQPKPPLQWTMCADISSCMKNAQGVVYNGQLHVGGGYTNSPKADTIIYAYNSEADMWKLLPSSPLKWFAMAVLNEQLVLVGGKEVGVKKAEYTNKLASWEKEKQMWSFSLPPMQAARISPIAFSHNHFLVVAGGKRGLLDFSVEILDSLAMQWYHASPLPLRCLPHTSALCNNSWCLLRESNGTMLQADVHTFTRDALPNNVREEQETGLDSQETMTSRRPVWKSIPKPGMTPLRIASIGKNLVAICQGTNSGKHLVVYTYFLEAGQWCHTGHLPQLCANASCVSTPQGHLYLVGGDACDSGYSNKVFRASLTVDT